MDILSCSAPSCEREIKSKKLCSMHYQRMRTFGYLEKPVELFTCSWCGVEKRLDKQSNSGQRFCSIKCGQKNYQAEHGERINAEARSKTAAKPPRICKCITCGAEFETAHKSSKYCSTSCCNKWLDANNPIACSEADCDRGVRAKGLCSMHWRRKAREDGREATEGWTERRKANYQKRRAQKLSLPSEAVRPVDVYERDEWVCGICSELVDRELSYPDPMSPPLDHVIPLSLGGHHMMENLALSHWICNVRKGNRIEDDAMSV